ncbi:MAG TPA: GNAT family N-acetyltransferase, partial [Rhizobiales bacterium]|nr:GNAT family N-acetyltransferase [Hyphomicrobiales bacterium]
RPMREAVNWLNNRGALIIFPAGDVAAFDFKTFRITEGKWDANVARLIRMSKAAAIPVFIDGRNSLFFHGLGKINPRLRTALYPREVLNKAGQQISLWIGAPIPSARLLRLGNNNEIARFLRLRTQMLKSEKTDRPEKQTKPQPPESSARLIAPLPKPLLSEEIRRLPPAQKLASSRNLEVYLARADQIPASLKEIGRLREMTFRANGEGTGKNLDLDLYDNWYRHLFLWNRESQEIAGAYRLGLGDEIMRDHGCKGFYSQSLFRFGSSFPQALNPAIELGRSFVCNRYQKSMTPMMLLWKGIGAFMVQNPKYAVLFGPVSISNEYTSLSQQLLIDFLRSNHFDDPLRRHIKPRTPFRRQGPPVWRKSDLAGLGSIDGISELVSSLEQDGKGAPVLMRHYLNIGGRMLGFNVDRNFGNCVDAMVVVDLREAHRRVLNRYMGAEGAARFLACHAAKLSLAS